jgi:hypothetical protein
MGGDSETDRGEFGVVVGVPRALRLRILGLMVDRRNEHTGNAWALPDFSGWLLRRSQVRRSQLRRRSHSVDSAQIRAKSVGSSELRSSAVNSRVIRNRSVRLTDISTSARESLRGQQGPPGPAAMTLRAEVSSGDQAVAGNARTVDHLIDFGRALTGCIYSATLAAVQAGPVLEQPEAGRITVATEGSRVLVRTFGPKGAALEQPFHLSAGC